MQMQRVKLNITETFKYNREVEVDIPADMDETALQNALRRAERSADSAEDLVYGLKPFGIVQAGGIDDDMSSPDDGEAECDDYEILEEGSADDKNQQA